MAPGWVDTDMAAEYLHGAGGAAVRAQSPLNRVASAEEIAATVLWLATEAPAFATGAIVDVNGASYLRSWRGRGWRPRISMNAAGPGLRRTPTAR